MIFSGAILLDNSTERFSSNLGNADRRIRLWKILLFEERISYGHDIFDSYARHDVHESFIDNYIADVCHPFFFSRNIMHSKQTTSRR